MEDGQEVDICRVCRAEGSEDKPLYYPCICTGSIKYIHQECLLQWLKHSKKEYCELCKHKFTFKPIYAPDMPKRLPIKDFVSGLMRSLFRAVRFWFHYTLVAVAWLGIVPLTAYRIYRCLFAGSVSSLLTLPLDMLSTENLLSDCIKGCFVVACTLCAFISLVWLREQIVMNGGPDWLEPQDNLLAPLNIPPVGGGGGGIFGGGARPAQVPGGGAAAPIQPDGDNDEIVDDEAPGIQAHEMEVNEQIDPAENAPPDDPDNQAGEDDANWNPMEWERAAEELTWERMLGLDGSLVFLEHVFWVVSLNTSFILVFAFCPFHIGQFIVILLGIEDMLAASKFEGFLTTILGYLLLAVTLIVCHTIVSFISLKKAKRILGLCYVVVKVSLLMVIEIGVFPLVCGWWLDICSLSLFGTNLKDRLRNFEAAPGTAMFLHWLVGMVYVFYFASFVLLLREVLRPGVLWFLRNLNDPDFHPVQEMIRLPLYRHARRFLLSLVVFGTTVMLMMYLPISLVKLVMPYFLPYHVLLTSEAPVSELSLELLLLQVILPALLEQGHTRQWLKGIVRAWAVSAAYLLDLRSYLLGDVCLEGDNVFGAEGVQMQPANVEQAEQERLAAAAVNPPPPVQGFHGENIGGEHAGLGFQPYIRPMWFSVRIFLLVLFMCASLLVSSFICLTFPVGFGRAIMSLWMGDTSVHELYTAACGLYFIWLCCRAVTMVMSWIPLGWTGMAKKFKEWFMLGIKCTSAAFFLVGVIPMLLGLLFELVVVVPLRVPPDQTALFFPAQDWALGILHMKIICAITMMGPNWWLKQALEQVYQDGIRNIKLYFIIRHLALPVMSALLFAITLPYVLSRGVAPIFVDNPTIISFCFHRIYPSTVALVVLVFAFIFQGRQFQLLYEHIKNDKYLVGKRLVNYNHIQRVRTNIQKDVAALQ